VSWNIGWRGSCAICALGTLILGLALVWLNIELVGISYEIRDLQNRLQNERVLQDKLEVERMNLSSSYRLREKAEEMGLRPPKSGEVLKVE
jgi:cell division protein FtsL